MAKTGWSDASPLGTQKIPRVGRNDRAHLCGLQTHQSGNVESAAVQAANRKTPKYEGLPASFVFQPVAIETMGATIHQRCHLLVKLAGAHLQSLVTDEKPPFYFNAF